MPFDPELLQRVQDELASESVLENEIISLTIDALRALARRIAARIGRMFEEVWEALRILGGWRE